MVVSSSSLVGSFAALIFSGIPDALLPGVSDVPAYGVSGVPHALSIRVSSYRPNSCLPFSAYSFSTVVPSSSSLNFAGIRGPLALYPDRNFIKILCGIATQEAKIDYKGSFDVRIRWHNH